MKCEEALEPKPLPSAGEREDEVPPKTEGRLGRQEESQWACCAEQVMSTHGVGVGAAVPIRTSCPLVWLRAGHQSPLHVQEVDWEAWRDGNREGDLEALGCLAGKGSLYGETLGETQQTQLSTNVDLP